MKTYLNTGAAGFIGANLTKYLLQKYRDIRIVILDKLTYAGNLATIRTELADARVTFYQGDITDPELVRAIFARHNINYVVNLAAESHVDRSIEQPQLFLETNILGTQNLLEAAKSAWIIGKDVNGYPSYRKDVKFLQVSTDEVYGSLTKDFEEAVTLTENGKIKRIPGERVALETYGNEFFTEQTPLKPRSPYAASKAGADFIVLAYAETYRLPVNITRCSNNYGPCQFPEKLIPLIINLVLKGEPLPVYGDGKNVRDWLYVEDHVKAIDLVLNQGRVGEVYNIGGFNEKQNITIVKLIINTIRRIIAGESQYHALLKTRVDQIDEELISYVEDRLGHDRRYAIDPAKIMTELGWYPETPFEVGIEKTVRWYLDHQAWVNEVNSFND